MEDANESARHAVNALLRNDLSRTPCDIFPMERRELRDLDEIRDLDRRLFMRGASHPLDSRGTQVLTYQSVFTTLWGEPDLTEDGVMAWRIEPIMAPVQLSLSLTPPTEGGGASQGTGDMDRGSDGQR